ncbi:MAG: sensor histidine kinase [Sphingobium sp.]
MPDSERSMSFRMARREMVGLFRNHDWSATDLGSPLGWPKRLQQLVEVTFNSPIPSFIICGAQGPVIYNGTFSKFCGDKHPDSFGLPFSDAFPEVPSLDEHFDQAFNGVPVIVRDISWPSYQQPEREERVIDLALTPVNDGLLSAAWLQGQVIRVEVRAARGIALAPSLNPDDGLEDLRVRNALHESEDRLRLALEVARLAMWDWDINTNKIIWSEEHFRMEGYEVGEVEPSSETWTARIHPEDLATTLTVLNAARASSEPFRHEFRFLHPNGRVVWSSALGRFFYNERGEAVRMVGVMHDVTNRRAGEERQRVLVAELQHRTRNLIGLVQSIGRKTLSRSSTLDDFRDRFSDRLCALARVQSLLSEIEQGSHLTFDELLRAELAAHGAVDEFGMGERVTLVGPSDVHLPVSAVQTLALALHELATNAAKYGALATQGHLTVRWRVEKIDNADSPILHVEWLESGVSMPLDSGIPPKGGGYGRELIEHALPYQLGAKTSFELGPHGVRCVIELPLFGPISESLVQEEY